LILKATSGGRRAQIGAVRYSPREGVSMHARPAHPEPDETDRRRTAMAKGQKKSNKEARKPKTEKPKTNASQPTQKLGSVKGLENFKNK
jgi:hypothetical protein